MRLLFYFLVLSFLPFSTGANPLDYYRLHFEKKPKHPLADTLFEKTVWRRKVSHLVLEERNNKFMVTLLMISPYPHNYKSMNYPLRYHFKSMAAALEKFQWLNTFLRRDGILRIKIFGSKIVKETILFKGQDQPKPKPSAFQVEGLD